MDDWTAKMLGTALVVGLAAFLKGRKHPMADWCEKRDATEKQQQTRPSPPPSAPTP